MKTLLVLAQHPDFAEAVRAGLDSDVYRVVHRIGFEEAEPLLQHGLISACILDVDSVDVQWIWLIEKLRRANRIWKAAAISLALVLAMLVANIFWQLQLAEAETYRAAAAAHKARQEADKQREKALKELEKARGQ